jgi:Domain of unknown function (DUF4259)
MGVWGGGGFENDGAADFVADVTKVSDIAGAFSALPPNPLTELDVDDAQRAIAAAECVACMLGQPAADMPAKAAKHIAAFGRPDVTLVDTARNAVSRVLRLSELTTLWMESDAAPFNRAITALIARLGPPPLATKPSKTKPKGKAKPAKQVRQNCSFCNAEIEPRDLFLFEITEMGDGETTASMRRGAWCHLACLNARLHPRHLVQNWKFDADELNDQVNKILGK